MPSLIPWDDAPPAASAEGHPVLVAGAAAIGVHLHGLVSPELCLLWGWRRPGGGQRSVRGHAGVVSV